MSLSDQIEEIPKGLTCACGECDLRKINVTHLKQSIKNIEMELLKKFKMGSVPIIKIIKEEMGEELFK